MRREDIETAQYFKLLPEFSCEPETYCDIFGENGINVLLKTFIYLSFKDKKNLNI
jgi:hypothetical protein